MRSARCSRAKRGWQRSKAESEGKSTRCPQQEEVEPGAGFEGVEVLEGRVEDYGEESAFRTMGVGGLLTLRLPRLSQHRTSVQRQGWLSI